MSTYHSHLSGGSRSDNCSSSSSNESSSACAPAHVYWIDSNGKASGSARLRIMLPIPTRDRVTTARCLIGGVSANVLRTLVEPNRSITFEIELPNGCALPRVCTRIVLVWTGSSGAPKVLTMTVREMEQEM